MMKHKESIYVVQSIERALDILEAFSSERTELSLTELSDRLGLHKSTAYRLLATLQARGYLETAPETKKYRLSLKLFELGSLVLDQLDLRRESNAILESLRDKCDETVHLVILVDERGVYIDKAESSKSIKLSSRIGKQIPLHCTAAGKVLLAYLLDEERAQILSKTDLPQFTFNTITNKAKLEHVLKQVRAQGFAVDEEEYEEGVRCVAAPVKDHTGEVIAALSISGPATRITLERIANLVELLKNAANEVSQRLGHKAG